MSFVVGKTTTREVYVISQKESFIQSEYVVINDLTNGSIIAEVVETNSYPFVDEIVLPEGTTERFISKLGINLDEMVHIARAKLLRNIQRPVMPSSNVTKATYLEVKDIISKADFKDSMAIGVIKGTEFLQDELPEEISNICPLWDSGSSVNQVGVPLLINHHSFREYPHIGLFGSSGSGKSFAMRVLLEEIMKLNVPALAFDPHFEMKFEGVMKGINKKNEFKDKYTEFIIGENIGIRFEDLSFSELVSLFSFVDSLSEPQKNALEVLYEKGDNYNHLLNKLNSLKSAFEKMDNPKSLKENHLSLDEEEIYVKCKNKVSGSATLQALSWKFNSLKNTNIFVSNIEEVRKHMKMNKLCVVRGDVVRLQMISSYLLGKLYSQRRSYIDKEGDYFPPFFTIVDEAHNFASADGANTPAKAILRKIGQEARKYGVFLTLCTQRPKNLDTTLLAQLNTKFIFRLTDQADMTVAKVEGNLSDSQVTTLPDLPSGHCFVSSATLNKTYPVRFRTTFSKAPNVLDPFIELKEKREVEGNDLSNLLLEYMKDKSMDIKGIKEIIPSVKRDIDENLSIKDITKTLDELESIGKITKETKPGVMARYVLNI